MMNNNKKNENNIIWTKVGNFNIRIRNESIKLRHECEYKNKDSDNKISSIRLFGYDQQENTIEIKFRSKNDAKQFKNLFIDSKIHIVTFLGNTLDI